MAGESPLTFGATTSLSATSTTGNAALPTKNSNQIVVTNLGPDLAYIAFGTDNTVTATTGSYPLLPGTQIAVTINPTLLYGAAITASTTATIKFTAADGYISGVGASSTGASGGVTDNINVAQWGGTATTLGQKAASASVPVAIASDQSALTVAQATASSLNTQSIGLAYSNALTITRPANQTPYTAGDVVGGALTFTSMGSSAGRIMLTSDQLELDITAIPTGMTNFTLYLYNVTPPSALADNAPWDLPSGDRASYLGYVTMGTPVDLGSTCYVETNILNKQIKLAGTSLFGYLVTAAGYTPAANSEVYVATLHTVGLGL